MQSRFYEGAIVERKKTGVITHPGIIVWHQYELKVIHNTPFSGGVIMSTIDEYADGQNVIISKKYASTLPPSQVALNARSALGKKWFLLFNCQHFVTWAAGHRPNSPDLNIACLLSIGALCFLSFRR